VEGTTVTSTPGLAGPRHPALDEDGYAVAQAVLDAGQLASIQRALDLVPLDTAGTRNLLDLEWCCDLAARIRRHGEIRPHLPASAVAIQCTLFDKTGQRNWLVTLHQDLSVPVEERVRHPSLRGWSLKEGRHYVQAPAELLERLVAVRVHLDDCGPENGPLRIVPRSHRQGRLDEAAALRLLAAAGEIVCEISTGNALLLRPLLLHASSKAARPGRRRVLHFLFGPPSPGYGLRWRHAV
jgi:ectoine hydroxylase-related dioxygenase (phytanoyl-CoA dioxygenase family)